MDFNADGRLDVITGEYWPGDIHLFWQQPDGSYAKQEYLVDESGRHLNGGTEWESENSPNMNSLAAAPFATDWDADGDYDMLMGNIAGTITLMRNIGTPEQPLFSTEREMLTAGGQEIRVGQGDSGPVHADWDQDGHRDLVVGCGDGAVLLFRNEGTEAAPQFAAAQTLIAPVQEQQPYPHQTAPRRPGTRTKVCVVDYNGDGHMDLLVGDYIREAGPPQSLTAEQEARKTELEQEMADYRRKATELHQQLEKVGEQFGRDSDEYRQAETELQANLPNYGQRYQEYSQLVPQDISHGFVWLYLRQPAEVVAMNQHGT